MLVSDLLDSEWECISSSDEILEFRKKIQGKELKIDSLQGDGKKARENHSCLLDVFETDIIRKKPGKIYVDDYYMLCYIVKDIKNLWETSVVVSSEYSLVTDHPFWIREKRVTYERKQGEDNGYLDYPYDYPYDYSPNQTAVFIENTEIMPADFKMVIQGPCKNPEITIGDNKYQIVTELSSYEYIVLNSIDRTAYKVSRNGLVTNVWASLNRDYDNFAQIPQGKHSIATNGVFPLDITMYMKRSEPRWS